MIRGSGIRWRPETGWEARCPDCAAAGVHCYWPITDEFWMPYAPGRCRACNARRAREYEKARYHGDPVHAERKRAYSRAMAPFARAKNPTAARAKEARYRGRKKEAA